MRPPKRRQWRPAPGQALGRNLKRRTAQSEDRSHLHFVLSTLVKGNVLSTKQATTLVTKVNNGHLNVQQATLLAEHLDHELLKSALNAAGRPNAKRRKHFYENELPVLLEIARQRAAQSR